MRMLCKDCGDGLPLDNPRWAVRCLDCFISMKRREEREAGTDSLRHEIVRLEHQNAELAKLAAELVAACEQRTPQFSLQDLRALRRLTHPDRHAQSKESNRLSKIINEHIREMS